MTKKFSLTPEQVADNIAKIREFMSAQGMEAFYISSFDPFLNEYVPMSNCHRFYFTNFSGSVAEVLIPLEGKVRLYVDGRYHEQADLECDLSQVHVVKVGANQGLLKCLKQELNELKPATLGLELDRTSLAFFNDLSAMGIELKGLANQELNQVVSFQMLENFPPIKSVQSTINGRTAEQKLALCIQDKKEAYFVTAIDSLAWISNCRGYHIPFSSAFLATGLLTWDKAYIFVDPSIKVECDDPAVEFIHASASERKTRLEKLYRQYQLEQVFIDHSMLNAQLYQELAEVFGESVLRAKAGGIIEWQSVKEEAELDAIRASFNGSDQAIYNTVKWVKEQVAAGKKISELDLYQETSKKYQEQGALTQSFNTISGADANGSIIHYGDPKSDVILSETSMVLLDSGGYFASGFATDTTRTFMASTAEGSAKQKEMYTLVLKGTLNLQNAVFKAGTRGGGLDAIARQPLFQAGYDFNHGTGHGVGIHVHEGGVGISPVRNYVLKPGQVVSIEPGLYFPGFGGVRIENIGIIIEHPEYEGFLTFEPLVYIGFEPLLIEVSLLNEQEKKWLEAYEAECAKRGRSFR